MGTPDVLHGTLENILKTVELSPPPDGDTIEEMGLEAFIARYPSYVSAHRAAAIVIAKGCRPLLEVVSPTKQRLAASIIRTHFNNLEIERYGR